MIIIDNYNISFHPNNSKGKRVPPQSSPEGILPLQLADEFTVVIIHHITPIIHQIGSVFQCFIKMGDL